MNLSTVKWAQWDKTQSRNLLGLFICVCIALCTIVAHSIAQNRPDSFPPYPPDNHHCSDDVYLREGRCCWWFPLQHCQIIYACSSAWKWLNYPPHLQVWIIPPYPFYSDACAVTVKEFWRSVRICRSCQQEYSGTLWLIGPMAQFFASSCRLVIPLWSSLEWLGKECWLMSGTVIALRSLTLLSPIRKSIWPVKKLSDEVLAWLFAYSEVRMICIWSSWCHCHPHHLLLH